MTETATHTPADTEWCGNEKVVSHSCVVYPLTAEQCYASEPCVTCKTRRDEHADQPQQSGFPELDITDHEFVAPVCEHGCTETAPYGFVPAAGCPEHDTP